ncbi:MAG: ATP-binding cassette domain-containing protein [Alphaproteobacteria bacterium]|nr:ATP-binding cassette domain-containing protein [Alphaproteobacteria bacterium]
MDAITADHLTKTYRTGAQALAGVSFRVQSGEIFGLLGPNGAGKSTTVRILATLTGPSGGSAQVAGKDVVRDPQGVRRSIGYVAQVSGVDRWATGRENLVLQAHLQRVAASAIRERVHTMLTWVGLIEAADRLVHTYSGGMKRRLDVAMGLVHDPSILFLDEPTTGLDPETRQALWRDLDRLRRERRLTVLLTTHYLEEADRLCDRLAIIDHGRVVVEGTPSELKAGIGGDVVELDVGDRSALAHERLSGIPGVIDVAERDSLLFARVREGATAVPALMSVLGAAGIVVKSMTVHQPRLDDVYLHHTGHHFAVDGPGAGKGISP